MAAWPSAGDRADGCPSTRVERAAVAAMAGALYHARLRGVVVQSVRMLACHAGGRGFESRPLRQSRYPKDAPVASFVFCGGRRLRRGREAR